MGGAAGAVLEVIHGVVDEVVCARIGRAAGDDGADGRRLRVNGDG